MGRRFSISATGNLNFGEGSFNDIPQLLAKQGYRRIALVTSTTFSHTDKFASFGASCRRLSLNVDIHCISGEPTVDSVDSVASSCSRDGSDVVVGIGGGSALDTAKAAAVMALHRDVSVKRYLEGVGDLAPPANRLPLVAVPTTAGTGSEATKNAVVAEIGPTGFKKSLRHDAYIPDMVVIDPTLALEVPFSVTAASGLDALTQLLEAYVSVKANPFIDSLALPAIGVAGKSLLSLLQGNLDDLSARTDMAYAAYISGIAIANAGLGYVHGFAGPLGALHPVPHGVVCGKLLAPLNRALVSRAMETEPNNILLEKYGKIATLWQVDGPLGVISHLEHLTNLADLPNLRTYGFTEYELSALGKKDAARNSPVRLAEETTVEVLGQLF